MTKEKKKDLANIVILILFFLGVVFFLTKFKYLYGSEVDWETQHWSFAEYFRALFYETHNIFPSFAFNLGAGQNIYNFSYYGFLNPLILISYFFPFIKMVTYVMIISVLGVIASIILLYKWLRSHNFNSNLSFLCTFLFTCAAPIILHSHRHIMFVNYLPFLILALQSVDTYFAKNKRYPLIISVFLIIMTSYFYSIPSLMVIIIYGVYVYLKNNNKITFKNFFKDGFKFLVPIVIGIFLASIILFPTLYTIFNGRNSSTISVPLTDLVVPKLNFDYLMYGSYSLGLTAIIIFTIIYGFATKKKENILLSTTFSIITLFPIIVFALNGFLYVNAKVLIPFVPLAIYFVSLLLTDLENKNVSLKKIIIPTLIITTICYFTTNWNNKNYYVLDILALTFGFYLLSIKNKKWPVHLYLIIVSAIIMLNINTKDTLMSVKNYNYIFNNNITKLYENIKTDNIYRSSNLVDTLVTSNKYYNNAYYNTSIYSSGFNSYYKEFFTNTFANPIEYRNHMILGHTSNPLWNTYMGIRNIISTTNLEYQKTKTLGDYTLYTNDTVYPIGYARTSLMSQKEFEELNYPYNVEALMKYTIVEDYHETNFKSTLVPNEISLNNLKLENTTIKEENNHYYLTVSKTTNFTVPLNQNYQDKVLLIRFKMNYEQKCGEGDTYITINNQKNTLTCRSWKYKNENNTFDYALLNPKSLNITIKKGTYDISDIESYIMDYQEIKDISENLIPFNINTTTTKGDVIEGTISTTKDAYFSLQVPYDKGFSIYVNDKKIAYEIVNTAFIGFPLKKGSYHIKIKYTAPLRNISLGLSGISLILTVGIIIIDRNRGKKICKKKK